MSQRSRGWQPGSARFSRPGEDDEPDPKVGPDIGVDCEDSAFPHVVQALLALTQAGFDPRDPDLVSRAVEVGRRRLAAAEPLPSLPPVPPAHPLRRTARERRRVSIYNEGQKPVTERQRVYYMRIGNRCKIGHTTNLWARLTKINPEELLAVEQGGRDLEHERHVQFRTLRTHGEWFRFEEPLVEHTSLLAAASREQVDEVVRQWKTRRTGPDLRDGWRGGLRR